MPARMRIPVRRTVRFPCRAPKEPEGEVTTEEPAIEPDAAGAARPPGPAPADAEPAGGLMRY